MIDKEYYASIPDRVLSAFCAAGADMAECTLNLLDQIETNCLGHEEYLLREFQELSVDVKLYCGRRSASVRFNQLDEASVSRAAKRAVMMAMCASEEEKPVIGFRGNPAPDNHIDRPAPERLYERFEEMMTQFKREYPDVGMDGMAWHGRQIMFYKNTDAQQVSSDNCTMMCGFQASANDGKDSTTDCVSYFVEIDDMDTPFMELGLMREKLSHVRRMLHPKKLSGEKFEGTLLFEPDGVMYYLNQLLTRRENMKEGDGYPAPECSRGFSVYEARSDKKYIQGDGAVNSALAEKRYLIADGTPIRPAAAGLEGSALDAHLETERNRAARLPFGVTGVEYASETPYAQLIGSVKRGILVGYISGTMPAPNGDFSGAVKDGFYIENGEIKYPVVECMVSGNVFDMFRRIRGVSSERILQRGLSMPYIALDGATII